MTMHQLITRLTSIAMRVWFHILRRSFQLLVVCMSVWSENPTISLRLSFSVSYYMKVNSSLFLICYLKRAVNYLNDWPSADVPEGCVIIREHIPITNLFTCLWFNEVDRFTSRDQLSFSTVRDKIMSKVSWSINMFLDCERRNFVVQVNTS